MQRELTISLSDETYRGLMKLTGEENAGQFIESVLRPHLFGEEYDVELPHSGGQKTIKIHSPHFVNRADADKFKIEMIENE